MITSSEIRNQVRSFYVRASGAFAFLQHKLQLLRLKMERKLGSSEFKPRAIATACWSFPIYSQTFVYQELTQLSKHGIRIRFLYSKSNPRTHLPDEFEDLWSARRKLNLHPAVCNQAYAKFVKRMPEKVESLIGLLCSHSGISKEQLFNERHFYQAFAFTEMVEAYRPDYIHSYFFYEGTLFALIASFLLDIPRGISCYSDHMLQDYVLKVVPLHLKQCNLLIATSEQIKMELLQIAPTNTPAKIVVKPNAINADYFAALENRTEPKENEPFRLVTISRIEPKKGLMYFLEAVRHLCDENYNIQAHIVGGIDNDISSQHYAKQLDAKIRELNLTEVVHLVGRKSAHEVRRYLTNAHLFIAPFIETESGDKDGIPTSLLEAMASGLPVVATNAGSISEVIENNVDGRLVSQRDSNSLSGAIKELLGDRMKRTLLGQNAIKKIHDNFDVKKCERIFHDALSKILLVNLRH